MKLQTMLRSWSITPQQTVLCVCVYPPNKADNMLNKSFRKILHEHKTLLKQNKMEGIKRKIQK